MTLKWKINDNNGIYVGILIKDQCGRHVVSQSCSKKGINSFAAEEGIVYAHRSRETAIPSTAKICTNRPLTSLLKPTR